MTTEQEFFKAFNYKPEIVYHIGKYYGGCLNKYITTTSKEYVKCQFANQDENHKLKIYKVEFNYPPITPEIVLGLEDVLFRLNCNVHLERALGTHENKSKPYKTMDGEIKYCRECHFEWHYEVFDLGDYFESKDKTYNDWRVVSQNEDRKEALLNIFKKLITSKDILINKKEIQDQVRGLFNE